MNKLKKFLENGNISIREFAKKLGISTTNLADILNGKRLPSLETAKKIKEATYKSVTFEDWFSEPQKSKKTKDN